MRAVIIHAPRDLRVETVTVPETGAGDVRIRIGAGGICGSDLHYYQHGGFGAVRIKEPMILGHEIAGTVESVGAAVTRVAPGDRVAVNPSRPCGYCRYCLEGKANQCLDMRFFGSAMRLPHVQGAFREVLVAPESQMVRLDPSVPLAEAAFAEPLAVCLHAANRAGPLLGRRVLVTGCGPIGVLSVIAARRAGAAEIVATDVADAPLAIARAVGADRAINIASEPDALGPYGADKGTFDVLIEASGNERALVGALDALRSQSIVVQVGLGGEFKIPINTIVVKEIEVRGAFRFYKEFELAAELIAKRLVDVRPLLTATLPLERAVEAFELASDRSRAMKVQLAFT
jgi:L-idonate 5-dehydrogenase